MAIFPPQGSSGGGGGGGGADLSDVDENVVLRSDHQVQWTDSTSAGGSVDTYMRRLSSGQIEVTNGMRVSSLEYSSGGAVRPVSADDGPAVLSPYVALRQNDAVRWSSGTAYTTSPDLSIARSAAGVLRVAAGAGGAVGSGALEVGATSLTLAAGDFAAGQSASGYRLQWDSSAGDLLVLNSSGATVATLTDGGEPLEHLPVGAMVDYGGATTPTGWLLCYGQAVSRTTYADLFTAIGTTWGTGDGSTTFNVPDLRGRVGVGKDDMGGVGANRMTTAGSGVDGDTLGDTGGSETHALAAGELASHTHGVGRQLVASPGAGSGIYVLNAGAPGGTQTTTSAGSGDAHNNTQPSAIVNIIIKATPGGSVAAPSARPSVSVLIPTGNTVSNNVSTQVTLGTTAVKADGESFWTLGSAGITIDDGSVSYEMRTTIICDPAGTVGRRDIIFTKDTGSGPVDWIHCALPVPNLGGAGDECHHASIIVPAATMADGDIWGFKYLQSSGATQTMKTGGMFTVTKLDA